MKYFSVNNRDQQKQEIKAKLCILQRKASDDNIFFLTATLTIFFDHIFNFYILLLKT